MSTDPEGGDYQSILYLGNFPNISEIAIVGDIEQDPESITIASKMRNSPAIFINGDLAYSSNSTTIQTWFNQRYGGYTGFLKASLGNHDVNGEATYRTLFNQPQWTYSFDLTDAHFLVINSQRYSVGGRTTALEIERDLVNAVNRGMRFLVVFQHIALKNHEPVGTNPYFYVDIPEWEAAYQKHKVDVVIYGHHHFYARYPKDSSGNRHITVGTGGAVLGGSFPTSGLADWEQGTFAYAVFKRLGQDKWNWRLFHWDTNGQLDGTNVVPNRDRFYG